MELNASGLPLATVISRNVTIPAAIIDRVTAKARFARSRRGAYRLPEAQMAAPSATRQIAVQGCDVMCTGPTRQSGVLCNE
ncbi:MAG: hypothetical protein J0H11_06745 [Rhizobiales bacterium]|nr:hypothetical protein [Hyphomicrobiales bacterium]